MENREESCSLILSDVIKGRYRLSSTSLFYNEYDNILPQELKLSNIIYCDIRNIRENSLPGDSKITVFMEFDLLMIYESISPDNIMKYHFHTETIKRNIYIDVDSYNKQCSALDPRNLRYRNLIRNIRCTSDIDVNCRKIVVSITASIDSLLLCEDIIKVPDSSTQLNVYCKKNGDEFIAVTEQAEVKREDGFIPYINQLSTLLEKASKIQDDNKRLLNECEAKDKRIGYLEYKYVQAEQECNNLHKQVQQKTTLIQELKSTLDNHEKKISVFEKACLSADEALKSLQIENAELKALLEKVEDKKKSQLNYKIKSVINKLII